MGRAARRDAAERAKPTIGPRRVGYPRRVLAAVIAATSVLFAVAVIISAVSASAAPAPPGTCPGSGPSQGPCRSDYNHDVHCAVHPVPAPVCDNAPAPQPVVVTPPPVVAPPAVVPAPQVVQAPPAVQAPPVVVANAPPPPEPTPEAQVQAASAPPIRAPREPIRIGEAPAPVQQQAAQPASLPPITGIASPLQISTDPRLIGINIFIALILAALLALPAELLNATIRENYATIVGWLGFSTGKVSGLHNALDRLPSHFALALFVIVGAVLYTFLDPGAGLNLTTAAEVLGLIGALAVITGTHDIARGEYMRRRFHKRGRLITFPGAIVFAIALVVVSRIFNFEPGFIFGLTTGIAFSDSLSDREDGHGLAIASLFVLAVSFVCWFIWIPVKGAAEGSSNPGFLIVTLDTLLATVWVAGIQSVVFSLIPIRFMDGVKVALWSRLAWLAIYVFALFVFVHTVLHPRDNQVGSASASVLYLSIMLGALTLVAVSLWLYFVVRNRRKEEVTEEVATA